MEHQKPHVCKITRNGTLSLGVGCFTVYQMFGNQYLKYSGFGLGPDKLQVTWSFDTVHRADVIVGYSSL